MGPAPKTLNWWICQDEEEKRLAYGEQRYVQCLMRCHPQLPEISNTSDWIYALQTSIFNKVRICLQCRRHRRCRFNPWVGKIPWRRKWQPTPVFLPEKSHGQSNLVDCSSKGCKELDTAERLSTRISLSLCVTCVCVLLSTHFWFSIYVSIFIHSYAYICICLSTIVVEVCFTV